MTTRPATQTRPALAGLTARPSVSAAIRPTAQTQPGVSAVSELNHLSRIVYAVPVERARALVPAAFGLDTRRVEGRECALLTVESFLDQGGPQPLASLAGPSGRGAFEQANYRLHVTLGGEACGWLIGTSLGSLSAVAARHLWPAPWHLGAMEFQVSYDSLGERYRHYLLRAQSQWANSYWEISDAGVPGPPDDDAAADGAARIQADYFVRRDGETGLYRAAREAAYATRGELKAARCDLLERLGLLTGAELMRPLGVSLQRRVTCRVEAHARPARAAA
jgi:hypothetical protein